MATADRSPATARTQPLPAAQTATEVEARPTATTLATAIESYGFTRAPGERTPSGRIEDVDTLIVGVPSYARYAANAVLVVAAAASRQAKSTRVNDDGYEGEAYRNAIVSLGGDPSAVRVGLNRRETVWVRD